MRNQTTLSLHQLSAPSPTSLSANTEAPTNHNQPTQPQQTPLLSHLGVESEDESGFYDDLSEADILSEFDDFEESNGDDGSQEEPSEGSNEENSEEVSEEEQYHEIDEEPGGEEQEEDFEAIVTAHDDSFSSPSIELNPFDVSPYVPPLQHSNPSSMPSTRPPSTVDLTRSPSPPSGPEFRNEAGRPNFSNKRPRRVSELREISAGPSRQTNGPKRRRTSAGSAPAGQQSLNPRIEHIDLLGDEDEEGSLQQTLAKQRADQIAAQNGVRGEADEGEGKGTRLTRMNCTICMEQMQEMVATMCGK